MTDDFTMEQAQKRLLCAFALNATRLMPAFDLIRTSGMMDDEWRVLVDRALDALVARGTLVLFHTDSPHVRIPCVWAQAIPDPIRRWANGVRRGLPPHRYQMWGARDAPLVVSDELFETVP